jgi:hypothetical protein
LDQNWNLMGLSFHYSGNIVKPELLPELIDEVKEIVKVFNWKYTIFDQQFPEGSFLKTEYNDKIYGICFTPPECETVFISFLSNGRMSSPSHLEFYGKTQTQPEREYLYMLSVKTQFAGVTVHRILIQLFRHLNKKYFTGFTMMDEGYYWETNNEELLKTTFKKYTALLDNFAFAAENFPAQNGENLENYLDRLFLMVKKKFDEI